MPPGWIPFLYINAIEEEREREIECTTQFNLSFAKKRQSKNHKQKLYTYTVRVDKLKAYFETVNICILEEERAAVF